VTEISMVSQAVPDRDQELSDLADSTQVAIDYARGLGADSSEVAASLHYGLDVNVRMGEVAHAQVVLSGAQRMVSEDDLKAYCMQHLAPFKVPEKIEFVDELARTASGKLIRQDTRLSRS
jgi:acyl-CoA synthetase (AMP-forming)/AMP-acid ligase II